jgi:sugar phosphate isomerase/epimerase
MKTQGFIIGLFLAVTGVQTAFSQYTNAEAEKLGWRLCAQAWTFNKFTFVEAIDKMKSAGINYVEMFPDQTIGGGLEGKTTIDMEKETCEKLLQLIQSKGMRLVNYGVVGADDQSGWLKIFEFAKSMGIETIVAEADSFQLNYIEPLCEQYKINIALHNHPDPAVYHNKSIYWNPDSTVQQISFRNKYIGVCADLGHWTRSGLNPLESLKKCKGRILDVHAKDLVKGDGGLCGYHDVPWGTGENNFSELMHELKRQGYKGTITIEYEYNWLDSFPEVKESVEYFYRLANWIGKE